MPLCFVLMPFEVTPGPSGRQGDFDAVYEALIQTAIARAGLEPLCAKAKEEKTCGITHRPMIEWLILCPYVMAGLFTANPNVFYELGLRCAVPPRYRIRWRSCSGMDRRPRARPPTSSLRWTSAGRPTPPRAPAAHL